MFGLMVAAPVGPISLVCIQRTVKHGRKAGIVSGLGAATADLLYGIVAAMGLNALTRSVVGHELLLRLVGGLLLVYLGVRAALASSLSGPSGPSRVSVWGDYTSVLLLTLSNPMTILLFGAILASDGMGTRHEVLPSVVAVCGIFCGSTVWWLTLATMVDALRERVSEGVLAVTGRVAGAAIAAWGIWAICQAL